MRRLLLLASLCAACTDSTPPGEPLEGPVRGLGFDAPIQPAALAQLEHLGHVVAVVNSSRVVIVISSATPERLAAVTGRPFVGPVVGTSEELALEVEVTYATAPSEGDLALLRTIGTVTANFPEYHAVFLSVRLDRLARLDDVPNATGVNVVFDPPRPNAS